MCSSSPLFDWVVFFDDIVNPNQAFQTAPVEIQTAFDWNFITVRDSQQD
jgi:hypothetical protein